LGLFDGGKSIVVFKVILTLCFIEEKLKTTNFKLWEEAVVCDGGGERSDSDSCRGRVINQAMLLLPNSMAFKEEQCWSINVRV
tara:strand:- start:116 stop:364 length:249 start_codon:yes stop_codon:yes gene_type:complete